MFRAIQQILALSFQNPLFLENNVEKRETRTEAKGIRALIINVSAYIVEANCPITFTPEYIFHT